MLVVITGHLAHNPRIVEGKIAGKLVIKDAFGKTAQSDVTFSETPLERVESLIPGISKIIEGAFGL